MLTLVLQNVVTLLVGIFALAAAGVYRRIGPRGGERRIPWLITALAFGMEAVNKGIQGAFGAWAYFAGPESAVWGRFLFWNPIFNHSRTFLLLAYCALLFQMAVRRTPIPDRYPRLASGALLAGMAAGALLGWAEKGFDELRHYSAVARWDVVAMLVLLVALVAAVLGTRVDRVLWAALGVYAFSLALNVLWFAAFSRVGMPGQWAPRPWEIQLYRVVLFGLMALLALHRLRLARRGTRVPALVEPPPSRIRLVG